VLPPAKGLCPGQFGWIDGVPPREQGKVLLMGEIGSKSIWYNPITKSNLRNDNVHDLFKRASKALRKHLRFPVWGKNTVHITEWEPSRSIGYSQGAADWVASGGELRQEGVRNILFSVSPDPHSKEQ
jgi:hypothetical protein